MLIRHFGHGVGHLHYKRQPEIGAEDMRVEGDNEEEGEEEREPDILSDLDEEVMGSSNSDSESDSGGGDSDDDSDDYASL